MAERRNIGRGTCQVCGDEFNLTSNGRIRSHGPRDNRCKGGSDHPREAMELAEEIDRTCTCGHGEGDHSDNGYVCDECSCSGYDVAEGVFEIRGEHGPEVTGLPNGDIAVWAKAVTWAEPEDGTIEVTSGPNPHRAPLPTTQPRLGAESPFTALLGKALYPGTDDLSVTPPANVKEAMEAILTGTADLSVPPVAFTAAVPVSQTPTVRGGDTLRPGPEKSDFDQWGRYKMPDPVTGAVSGRQRVTTFAKMISDQWGLSQWQQRVLLVGSGNNPQMTALAAGKDPKFDKTFLDGLADTIKDAAGSKDAASHGTLMHTYTEKLDMGLMGVEEFSGLPDRVASDLIAYRETIEGADLTVIPEMVERTTMVRSLDVTGTLDRILRLPNGDHVIGDVKTGQDLSYGWLDIGVQLACYAYGVNENGIFDWGSRQWMPAPKVRTDFAIVMHMPAGKGTCTLYRVDLNQGWANCALARSVRDARKVRNHAEVLDLDSIEFQGSPQIQVADLVAEPTPLIVQPHTHWYDTGETLCEECGERKPAPLVVQPHSESFTPSVAPDPTEDARRVKAREIMRSVASQQAARELYGFAMEVWPNDGEFLLELATIGCDALRAAGYQTV